jgi:lipopolysaccharide export system permease protein
MQRNNELLPLLSAGVPTRRIVFPILLSASMFLTLAILNQELLIPRLGNRLLSNKDEEDNQKDLEVQGAFVSNDIFIEGQTPSRRDRSIKPFFCLIRGGSVLRTSVHLSAEEAHYIPPGNGRYSGGWLMTGTHPDELDCSESSSVLERIDPGKYFLYTPDVDFDTMTRPRTWFQLTSTYRLYEELQKPDTTRLAQLAVLFHMRLTRPILGVILVVLGLSTILKDQNRNVFVSAGLCLILCAVFFTALFVSRQLGDKDILSPALAAWLPVLVFGPLAFVKFDAVHT